MRRRSPAQNARIAAKYVAIVLSWAVAIACLLWLGLPAWMVPPLGTFSGYLIGSYMYEEVNGQ
jgi:hypothetical protein